MTYVDVSLKRQFFSDGTFSYKSLVRNRTRNGRVRSASAGLPPFLFHLWLSSQDAQNEKFAAKTEFQSGEY